MFYSETVYVKYKDHQSISLPSPKQKFLIFYIFYLFLGTIIYWRDILPWIILLIWKYVYDRFFTWWFGSCTDVYEEITLYIWKLDLKLL